MDRWMGTQGPEGGKEGIMPTKYLATLLLLELRSCSEQKFQDACLGGAHTHRHTLGQTFPLRRLSLPLPEG